MTLLVLTLPVPGWKLLLKISLFITSDIADLSLLLEQIGSVNFPQSLPLGTRPPQIEQEEAIEVNVTTDPDMGTIYSVAVPVRRVKPTARIGLEEDAAEAGVSSVEWDADEWDADPAARFPWGT